MTALYPDSAARTDREAQTGYWEDYPLADLDNVVSGDLACYLGVDIEIVALDATQHFDADRIQALAPAIAAAGRVTEPLVVHVHPDGRAVLRDGHHRYVAARDLGLRDLPVEFHQGVLDPATGEVLFPTDSCW